MSRRVLITAGCSGIGLGLARRFAAQGDRIAVCDADAEAVARVQADHPDFVAHHADVTDEAQMAAFLGAVEGDRMERVLANENAATGVPVEDLRKAYVACTSMKTWVSVDDLADMALFLASPAASKISGQVMAVDGHTESVN